MSRPHDRSGPPAPVRMVALDLDGTTLRTDKSVGPRTIKALHAAHAKGIEIVLASGRMTPAMEETANALGLDVCLISYNGAVACGHISEGRKRIYHQPLDPSLARELFEYAHPRRFQINFYDNDVIVSEDAPHLRPFIDIYRSRTGSPFHIVDRLETYLDRAPTKMLFCVEPAKRPGIEQDLRPRFESRTTMLRTDPEYLEFLDPTVNKGRGVRKLAEMRGIQMQEVMAMGDGENDIAMLEVAGWAVAVANAGESCKKAAHALTHNDHNHDAVAEALERWVL